MIDQDGFRENVGIILCNSQGELFWARRIGQNAWQFPQGGLKNREKPEQALYRELYEEVGLQPNDVQVITKTKSWLRYRLPENLVRHDSKPLCIGQKQIWFLLLLLADENNIRLDNTDKPEFDRWRWVDYTHPLEEVIAFKREVYREALMELVPYINQTIQDSNRITGSDSQRLR
jgi:putative (di)nucleoside polyphosphate hydrolase